MTERTGSYIPYYETISTPSQDAPGMERSDSKSSIGSSSKVLRPRGRRLSGSSDIGLGSATPDTGSVNGGGSVGGQGGTPHNRAWKAMFANINRGVDELYYFCEDEGDEVKCREALGLLERAGYDFDKLIDRIEEQRKFDLHQTNGVCWEVRKPTGAAFHRSNAEVSVYMRVYVCVCMYVYVSICMYVCMNMRVCVRGVLGCAKADRSCIPPQR